MTTITMKNAIARKFFLHDVDTHHDTDQRCCFFAEGLDADGWGFWIRPDGTVDVDDASSNGELPSAKIVDACRRAAVAHLRNR